MHKGSCQPGWGALREAASSNRSVDSDTQRQGAASRAREHTSRGALPVRAGQLRRYAVHRRHARVL
jgi:hypothetical protein